MFLLLDCIHITSDNWCFVLLICLWFSRLFHIMYYNWFFLHIECCTLVHICWLKSICCCNYIILLTLLFNWSFTRTLSIPHLNQLCKENGFGYILKTNKRLRMSKCQHSHVQTLFGYVKIVLIIDGDKGHV